MTLPLLNAQSLSKTFSLPTGPFGGTRSARAVDAVDLAVYPGEAVGLAGESGCGKSTIAKMMMGLLTPSGGSVSFEGKDIARMSRTESSHFRKSVQMVFQDPFSALNPRMRVGDIIAEPMRIHGVHGNNFQRFEQVLSIMRRVGLAEEHLNRYPHEFSGGQRQRIGIARSLAVSPRMIIADEPVSALDLSVQAQIINLLQELRNDLSLSFLFIAHDLSVVRHICDRVAIMYFGKIVEYGSRDNIFSGRLHPYTEALLSAIPQIDPARRGKRIVLAADPPSPLAPPSGCAFHPRCPYARPPVCMEVTPPLEEKEPGHAAACHFSGEIYR